MIWKIIPAILCPHSNASLFRMTKSTAIDMPIIQIFTLSFVISDLLTTATMKMMTKYTKNSQEKFPSNNNNNKHRVKSIQE